MKNPKKEIKAVIIPKPEVVNSEEQAKVAALIKDTVRKLGVR